MASAAGVAGVRATLDLSSKTFKCVQCGEPDSANRRLLYAACLTIMRPNANDPRPHADRRAFLRFLAGSPYVAALGGIRTFGQNAPEIASVIGDPGEALNVMDFEEAAHRKALPGHWAYIESGVDDDLTPAPQPRRLSVYPASIQPAA